MTREEAIKEFEYGIISDEAAKMAIKALEQEPCEDAISRSEVKKMAKEMYLEVASMELDVNTISDCISYTSSKCREVLERKLQALPSVTPKQKTGKWIKIKNRNGSVIALRCSECSKSPKYAIRSDYCPNCGAKMEGEA